MTKTTTKTGTSEITTEYKITPLTQEHMQSTADLFIKTFCDSEPITKHLGIQYHEYEPFVMDVIQKAVKEGLGVVAIDKNNRVIACAMGEDITHPFTPNTNLYPKMKPILALLEQLSKPFLAKKFKKGKIAHIWVSMVDDEFRGQGLSTIIDLACTDMCVRKGYIFTYAEFTNPISEKVAEHYPFSKKLNSIKLDEFTYQGQKPFKGLTGEANAYLLGMKPGTTLDMLKDATEG